MSSNSGSGGGGGGDRSSYRTSSQQAKSASDEPTNQRYSNLIYDSEVFLTKLREFKPQSLGCLEARRKSSSTLIFPNPRQACMGPPKCSRYPHDIKPTPGYWIECHGGPPLATVSGKSGASGAQTVIGGVEQQHSSGSGLIRSPADCAGGDVSGGRASSGATGGQLLDELKLIVDAPSGRSSDGSTTSDRRLPSLSATERGPAMHDRDLIWSQVDDDEMRRPESVLRQRQSLDQIETTYCSDQQHLSGGTAAVRAPIRPESSGSGALLLGRPILGSAVSAIEIMSPSAESTQSSAENIQQQTSGAVAPGGRKVGPKVSGDTPIKNVEELRKRLNKRTMTRDDIDLHKPRRGTPNITITEPSFNQSTVAYQSSSSARQQRRFSRQGSQTQRELKRLESLDSGSPSPSPTSTSHEPMRFQSAQNAPSTNQAQACESLLSMEESPPPFAEDGDNDGATYHHQSKVGEGSEAILEEGEPSTIDIDTSGDMDVIQGSLSYRQQQHRPSVIHEDSDAEADTACQEAERSELYSGLSITTFQKRPYQQAYQQSQQLNTEQFKDGSLELISFEEENYEKHYYGREHWNYFTNDELLGPVMLSLKQEVNNQRDHFHVLLRTVSYTLHGTIPASTICADRYDREAIVRELSEIAKLKPPLMLGQLPSTPDELLKLDHIFIKTELKVGVIYIKAGQEESEEAILGNKEESPLFAEFLDLLGDRITLKGFDRYKGGLDTVHNLTGTESVYTMWRNIEIMFHVSTMLPHEENDPQKLQKKRHVGNDIVCVAFIESDDTLFWPGCIKSYFLHTFITVKTSPKPLKEGEKRKYSVSCVCRNEVQYAFKPYLIEQDEFYKSDYLREWLLVKIVNGERASYSAPKFARMQDRTRSQLLEDIVNNLANHLMTGQIPKPYRRGSWRPLGHTRASSPLEDSMKDYFEDYEQLAKDFHNSFCGPSKSVLCDVVFKVRDRDGTYKLVHGVRAIMAIRSRTFAEMLYGVVPPGNIPSNLQNQTNLRAIEMKALAGESSAVGLGREMEQASRTQLAKRGSVGADSSRKIGEKERRQSMLPNLSKSITHKPTYLTVPSTSGGSGGGGGGGGGSGTGGMIKNAFNRLVSGNWSGWSGTAKGYKGEPIHIKVDQNKTKVDLNSLAICKEIAKIDAAKLSQWEFDIKEFDYETFQQTIEYIHNGQCKLSYETIPGLICAAEHYDLPDLLHACFHHANTHMKLSAAPKMMNALFQSSCFYVTAMQLLDSIYEFIDPHGNEFFSKPEHLELNESVFTTLLSRKTLQVSELKKFQAMHGWTRHKLNTKQSYRQQQLRQQQTFQIQQSIEYDQKTDKEKSFVENPMTNPEEIEIEYRNLMSRLNKEVNIKLDKISNEDLVKIVLPTKVFSNDKVFEIMSDESRMEY